MKKKILFVGGGEFQADGIRKAKELGYYSIVIDGNPNAMSSEFADEFYHIDIINREDVLKVAVDRKIDGIASIASEITMESMSYVATKLDLPGFKYELVQIAHDKKQYYQKFENASIPVPYTVAYNNNSVLSVLKEKSSYIIKPSKGSGSRGVKKTSDISSFDFLKYKTENLQHDEEILIQEFIEGKELTVDGFIQDGKFFMLAVSEEMNDKAKGHTFSSELIFPPVWISEGQTDRISELCNNVVKSLDIKDDGPMHLELIYSPQDVFYIIDFSLRGGGFDLFTKIIKKTSGVDALELYLNSVSGKRSDIPVIRKFNPVSLSFAYSNKSGKLVSIEGYELQGLYENHFLKFLCKPGQTVYLPEGGRHRLVYFICWGDNVDSVIDLRDHIRNRIDFIVE